MVGIDAILMLSVTITLGAALGHRYFAGVPVSDVDGLRQSRCRIGPGAATVAVSPDVIKNVILPPLLCITRCGAGVSR